MSRKLIATRLKSAMGLHTPTVGMVTISSAIDRRMRACEIDNYDEYLMRITSDNEEMKELIEAVIIPETWFFREAQPYKYMLRHYHRQRETSPGTPFRILSAPCSTGEEPYSIAMTMMDNQVDKNSYIIDAVDIGQKHIEKAKRGVYRGHSFRSEDLSFIHEHFTANDELYHISDQLKSAVDFRCANILQDSFNCGFAIYDVIFCRNLLIYFDAATQAEVFDTLDRLLKPDGLLVLGHAETPHHSAGKFVSSAEAGTYVYVKANSQHARQPGRPARPASDQRKPREHIVTAKPRPFANTRPGGTETSQLDDSREDSPLERAFKLANSGDMSQALTLCRQYIEEEPFSSRAHYLAGIIHDNLGDTSKADDHLRKSIYLDPDNLEALIHLSLMAEQNGDSNEATLLRNRAQRVQERRPEV